MTGATPFLDAADEVGRRLCRDALWAGDRCNWLGWSWPPGSAEPPRYQAQSYALGDGTAGIALFLGQLASFTGDPLERDTMRGALRHVRRALPEVAPAERLGFHHGLAGVASACEQLAGALGDELAAEVARAAVAALLEEVPAGAPSEGDEDPADAISVLLHGGLEPRPARAIDRAIGCSARLRSGVATRPRRRAYEAAAALLELQLATGDDQYGASARAQLTALDAPASDAGAQRARGDAAAMPSAPPAMTTERGRRRHPASWEAGAAGLVSAQLRVRALWPATPPPEEDLAALVAAVADEAPPSSPAWPYGLGNGLAGCGDVLLDAAEILQRPLLAATAQAIGRAGIARYAAPRLPWPCGLPGETPNLLGGLAGIGLLFLRLHAPTRVPSPLRPARALARSTALASAARSIA